MTDQQIRLHFGELNASEMRLARAIVGWHEARETKLRAAADGLAEALRTRIDNGHADYCPWLNWAGGKCDCGIETGEAALAAYQVTKP